MIMLKRLELFWLNKSSTMPIKNFKNKNRSSITRLIFFILLLGCISSINVLAESSENNESEDPLDMRRPGSIGDRLEEDAKKKDYLFQIPGVSEALAPWYQKKQDLDEKYGLKYGISYTSLYQKASDTIGPEDDAASSDLDISGTWTFLGRGTDSPTELGFNFFWRDDLGTEIPPQALFAQVGSLYSNAAPYGENDPVIGELWLQKKFSNKFGFRIGKIFPITAYDFFPFKNFRTDFVDFNHVTNATIPLPGNGLGTFAVYRPKPNIMLRAGVHDANADVEKSGFDTYEDGEIFKILEVGFDTGLIPRVPGRPPHGHLHFTVWHQDKRDDPGIDDGWGIGVSVVQTYGRFKPFARAGYADINERGPTPAKHMANIGLVTDGIFGQANDRIGIGYTWSDPADSSLDNQHTIDAYYRVQVTSEIQFGPTLELIFDPVRNPDDDTIYIWGLRARIAL